MIHQVLADAGAIRDRFDAQRGKLARRPYPRAH